MLVIELSFLSLLVFILLLVLVAWIKIKVSRSNRWTT